MDIPIIPGIVHELKTRPWSMLSLIVLLAGLPYTWQQSARASDVVAIQAQLTDIVRQNKEAQLAAIETELFQLQQQVNDKLAGKKPVDDVYYSRINQLLIEKGRIERELGRQP